MTKNKRSRVHINRSSIEELTDLPGIGPKRAEAIVRHRESYGPFLSMIDLSVVLGMSLNQVQKMLGFLDWTFGDDSTELPKAIQCDAREIAKELGTTVDLIVTSPPYWLKRDYEHELQIGQEETSEAYIQHLCDIIDSWKTLLERHSTVILNIGDTFRNHTLVGIPTLLEQELLRRNWLLVNKIVWSKTNGLPEPKQNRLASRYEVILQLARNETFYADSLALADYLGQNANPGDVWQIPHSPSRTDHLAPFPDELVRRLLHFAAPTYVCLNCGMPFRRDMIPTFELAPNRPQAQRAIELFEGAGLTRAHLDAIRAVGISDAGKGKRIQSGANGNASQTKRLAEEAKIALRGYFREFTFGRKVQSGWVRCSCELNVRPGIILDPFMGSGTTLRVAKEMGRIAYGSDLVIPQDMISKAE